MPGCDKSAGEVTLQRGQGRSKKISLARPRWHHGMLVQDREPDVKVYNGATGNLA